MWENILSSRSRKSPFLARASTVLSHVRTQSIPVLREGDVFLLSRKPVGEVQKRFGTGYVAAEVPKRTEVFKRN